MHGGVLAPLDKSTVTGTVLPRLFISSGISASEFANNREKITRSPDPRLLQQPGHHPQQLAPALPHDQPRPFEQELGLLNKLENHLGPVARTQDTGRVVDTDYPDSLADGIDVAHGLRGITVSEEERHGTSATCLIFGLNGRVVAMKGG